MAERFGTCVNPLFLRSQIKPNFTLTRCHKIRDAQIDMNEIATVEDLATVLQQADVSLEDVAPSIGVTRQALNYRLLHGEIDGLTALAILRAAIRVTEARLDGLRNAVQSFEV